MSNSVHHLGPVTESAAPLAQRLQPVVPVIAILGLLVASTLTLGAFGGPRDALGAPWSSHPALTMPRPEIRPANGTNATVGWSQVGNSNSVGPSIRDMSMMAYDPVIGKVVLFGGYDPSVAALGDTWEYGNGTWTELNFSPPAAPAPRWHAGFTWDAADGVLVLFGGRDLGHFFNDSWTFNGTAWTNVTTATGPSPRGLVGMTYDAADGYVLLFGGGWGDLPAGTYGNWTSYADTWSFRAGTWTDLTARVHGVPPARVDFGMSYDPQTRAVVAVGGTTDATQWCDPSSDVWQYAAGNWTNVSGSPSGPPTLVAPSLAYYPRDSALLLFGGATGSACTSISYTYELRNTTWVNLTSGLTNAPIPRYESTMSYDAADGSMVLFGGAFQGGAYFNDTYLFPVPNATGNHGVNSTPPTCSAAGWCLLSTPASPADRDMTSMAYDPAIGAVVLFGGYSQFVYPFGDTWTYANGNWTDISNVVLNSPSARWGHSLVWDASDHYLVLFGGRNLTQFFNDTWVFNGSTWSQIPTASAPSPRDNFGMTYDARSGTVILYGGWRGNLPAGSRSAGPVFNDTWSYHAGIWTNITRSVTPPSVTDAALAYDNATGAVLLYGGNAASGCPTPGALWGYINGTWSNFSGSQGSPPPGTVAGSMVYYPGFSGELFFGGAGGAACASSNATYRWAGGVWINETPVLTTAPTPRYEAAIAYDPAECRVVLFGGSLQGSWSAYYSDTWVLPGTPLAGNGSTGGCVPTSGGGGNWGPPGSAPPLAGASQTVESGVAPLSVLFDVVATVSTGPATIHWNFGDGGTTLGGNLVAHTYLAAGTFVPTVRVTDSAGRTTLITLNSVLVLAAPAAGANAGGPGPSLSWLTALGSPAGLLSGAFVGGLLLATVLSAYATRARQRQGEAEELRADLEAATSDEDG
ncbi:MAG TPA: kelch repeat-containing protein [Thermoplasmata archaeon]|nr:kelch repeat-containing protein [Thermoplasmata archaeon]